MRNCNRKSRSPRSRHRVLKTDEVPSPPERGPLYPLHIFGTKETYFLGADHMLIFSILTSFLFLIPSFRMLPQAPLWKLFPTGLMALTIFLKRSQVPMYADKTVMLCAVFAMHSFGDSLLAQSDVPSLMEGKSPVRNMAVSTLLFGFGFLLNSVLVLTELKEEDRTWSMMSLKTKSCIICGLIYGLGVIIFLLKNLELEKNDGAWMLLLVPYVMTEVFFFASAMMANHPLMIIGTILYFMSDTCIALEDALPNELPLFFISWPLYYIAQWLLFISGLQWIQKHNENDQYGNNRSMSLFNRLQNILSLLGLDMKQYVPIQPIVSKQQRAKMMQSLAHDIISTHR